MLEFLYGMRQVRRGLKKARIARALLVTINDEILRQSMAYAWEIGHGAPLVEQLSTSSTNPFLDPSWRKGVLANV